MVGAQYISRCLLRFEYNNYKMGKKSFVRVMVGTKQYRLNRSDITRTHFIKKSPKPALPQFYTVKNYDSNVEL